jgi:aryl-alcohol dehydrogenase-like predicted oxidoreductase
VGCMRARALGREGLSVSAVGLGCMGLSQAYGPADDEVSVATLHAALELGVSLWDTAMSYGGGHNEWLLGRAIAGHREQVVLASKFGIVRGADGVRLDARPEQVRGFCEASLSRLGVEHLDLYYLHRVDPQVPIEETIGAMAELVIAGKVAHLGVSEVTVDELERAVATHPISALQCEWSLFWREVEDDMVPAARRLGVGLVPYSPLGRGMLTGALPTGRFGDGDFRGADPRFQGEQLTRNLALVEAIGHLAAQRDVTPSQLALAWLLAQGGDVVPIPGTRRRERLAENAAADQIELSTADLHQLQLVAPRAAWTGDRQSFAAHHTTRTPT